MRGSILIPLLILTGCTTMREVAGRYSAFAERGIELKRDEAAPPPAAATTVIAPPGGLAGDGKTHVYSEPTPRSS